MKKGITLKCGTVITYDEIESSKLSYVPCGQVEGKDKPLLLYAHLTKTRKQVTRKTYGLKFHGYGRLTAMNGVQLMTGLPTFRHAPGNQFYYYTSIDIERRMRDEHPDLVDEILQIYRAGITGNPCEVETKSGGLRLETYSLYVGKTLSFKDEVGMLLEILAGGKLVKYDHRYRMRRGSILNMPTMESNQPLQEIYAIGESVATKPVRTTSERKVADTSQIGDIPFDLYEVTLPDGRKVKQSQLLPTQHCINSHTSNREEVRITEYPDGSRDLHCFNCSETWRIVPPKRPRGRRQKPIRLIKSGADFIAEALNTSRKFLSDAFARGKGFIGLRSDTGVGKDHYAILHFKETGTRGYFSVPTTQHAIETAGRMHEAGLIEFRWRGLQSEPDGEFPHEKPCVQPERYMAYLDRGRNAYEIVCAPCPCSEVCNQHGFRSQADKVKKAQVTVGAHRDLLFNPVYRNFAKQILPKNPEDTIVINEFDPFQAFLEMEVPQARLEYLVKTWHDHNLGTFARLILQACLFDENPIATIRGIVDRLPDKERDDIRLALTQYRIGDTILSKDKAEALEQQSPPKTLTEILALPLIETDDWNLLSQLEIFMEQYPDTHNAPMRWEKNTLHFALPPMPMFTKARVICMSATLEEITFLSTFKGRQAKRGDVAFLDGEDTEWDPDGQVFQLRTNGNSRRTLLEGEQDEDGNWKYTGELTPTGKAYMKMILESLAKTPGTRAFISHKLIVKAYTSELDALGVKSGWFGGLAGLDEHFDRDKDEGITLHILGSPELPPHESKHRAKLLGITVEQVHENSVKAELVQAFGRAGLVKNPSRVVLWTSLYLPSITPRAQTLLFDDTDFAKAEGHLPELPRAIAEREQSEAEGDVQGIVDATGVSERTAQRKSKPTRDATTAERDARILELHGEGKSQRVIEATMKAEGYKKASFRTVGNIIKASKLHREGCAKIAKRI